MTLNQIQVLNDMKKLESVSVRKLFMNKVKHFEESKRCSSSRVLNEPNVWMKEQPKQQVNTTNGQCRLPEHLSSSLELQVPPPRPVGSCEPPSSSVGVEFYQLFSSMAPRSSGGGALP